MSNPKAKSKKLDTMLGTLERKAPATKVASSSCTYRIYCW